MTFETVDPSTGHVLKSYRHQSFDEIEPHVQAAWTQFELWRERPLPERARALTKWADGLKAMREELARQMTLEMGKPIAQARAEIDKSIHAIEHIVQHGPEWIAPRAVAMPSGRAEICFAPLGPILAIMPWNFPLWQVVRFAAPGILAGNTILLKHADLTMGCAELIERSAQAMNEGPSMIRLLRVDHEVAARVIAHPRVRGVTFTGSTRGGREVAQTAAKFLKKSVLELGGSDAYVVWKDADVAKAATACAEARLVNGGQSCVAAKRFIVHREVLSRFVEAFVPAMSAFTPASPADETTRLGPLAAKKFQEQLVSQVADLQARGGQVLCGGTAPAGAGAFYPPTVVLFDRPQKGLGDVEIFGPVAIVIGVDSDDEGVRVAADGIYGLGGAIFSGDVSRARAAALRMEAGFVAVNDSVKSDARLPFGGVKESGWGRELSEFGILEFCNIQSRTWPA